MLGFDESGFLHESKIVIDLNEDNFTLLKDSERRASHPRWEDESKEDYEKRLEAINELDQLGFKYLNTMREARRPFYPLVAHIEAHISVEFAKVRKDLDNIICIGLILIFFLAVIAAMSVRHHLINLP